LLVNERSVMIALAYHYLTGNVNV